MDKKAILLDMQDNVATCTSDVEPQDLVLCRHYPGRMFYSRQRCHAAR